LVADPLRLPTIPLPAPFWLAVLRPALPALPLRPEVVFRAVPLLERELLVRRLAVDFRAVPLLERDELVRPVEAAFERDAPPEAAFERDAPPEAAFERDAPPEARVERLREEVPLEFPLAFALDPDPLDEPRLFCPLPEAVSAAIPCSPSSQERA
jgi:hypothetical protein